MSGEENAEKWAQDSHNFAHLKLLHDIVDRDDLGEMASVVHQPLIDILVSQGLSLLSMHGRGLTYKFWEDPFTLIYVTQHLLRTMSQRAVD